MFESEQYLLVEVEESVITEVKLQHRATYEVSRAIQLKFYTGLT